MLLIIVPDVTSWIISNSNLRLSEAVKKFLLLPADDCREQESQIIAYIAKISLIGLGEKETEDGTRV